MTKGWRKFSSQDKGKYVLYKKNNKKEYVEIYETPSGSFEVTAYTEYARTLPLKSFKTKSQALAYARAYMRTH